MSASSRPPDSDGGPDPIEAPLPEALRALPDLLEELPERTRAAERVLAALADVEVAHEELRVAEEEMRVQQEQITQLLVQHDAERRWRGHMSALVPVGLAVTDGNGTVIDANPALATHIGMPLHRLLGKPLSVYLDPKEVSVFRDALRLLSSGEATEQRLSMTVTPRRRARERAFLFGFAENADHQASLARIQWVFVPEDDPTATDVGAELSSDMPAEQVIGLATSLAELAALPVEEGDRQRLLSRMATLVRGAVPAADWVSITIGPPGEPQRLGSDSIEAQDFDGRQVWAGEGPCWSAYSSGSVVIVDDVTTDQRWPALAQTAGESSVRSVLALPVHDDGATTGVVNVYSGVVAAFPSAGRRIGELVTAAVSGVLQNAAERESMRDLARNLERALASRAVIDQAKGVIMARLGVNADDAFARLVNVSSRLNVKVRDLAALIVEGHIDAVLGAVE